MAIEFLELAPSRAVSRPYDWAVDEPRPFDQEIDADQEVAYFINGVGANEIDTKLLSAQDLEVQMNAGSISYINKRIQQSLANAMISGYAAGTLIAFSAENFDQWALGTGTIAAAAGVGTVRQMFINAGQQG